MEDYLSRLTDYLLTQSWQIAVLVVVVATVSFALKNRSSHVRYLLWLVVLAKCLVPPLLTVPLAVLPVEEPVTTFEPADISMPEPVASTSVTELGPPVPRPTAQITGEKPAKLTTRQWLGLAWIAGVTAFVLLAVTKALRTEFWLRRERKLLPDGLQREIENIFSGLGIRISPRLWLVEGISQPFVWGLIRGSIYLPGSFTKVNAAGHRRGVLGHELSHILRFDAGVNLLQIVAQAVFWFHPFVWWANKRIRAEREKCCDEMAIARLGAQVKDYSRAIVDTLVTEYESARPVPSLAVAGPVKNIEERIKTMLRPGKIFYKRPSLIAATTVLLAALLTVPTALVLTARAGIEASRLRNQTTLPLHEAALAGDIEKVKSLIAKGADVNERGTWGATPLHYTCMKGHADVAKLLISKGAYINVFSESYGGLHWLNEMTPLHCAAASGDRQTVELLLSKGANLEAKSRYGSTPLLDAMKSAAPGHKEVVELLLAKGAKVPALHLAAYLGDVEKVKRALQDGADINSQADDGGTALHAAACSGRKDIVQLLISRGAKVDPKDASGLTPLYYATTHNTEEIVDLLVAKGADVDATNETEDGYGHALLHYAIAQDDSKDAIKLLINKGANVNVRDWDGFTPLMWATWESGKDVVELLISKGADVNQQDNYGCTALHQIATLGNKDMVELLLAKGAAPLSSIHSAVCAGDLAKVKSLVEEGDDVNRRAKGSGGQTPLFAAVYGDHIDIARFLIAKGANVNAKDMAGQTPLHVVCVHGKRNMVELLIAEGADVNARDYGGCTPLHRMFTIGRQRMDIAELLIAKGADVNAKLPHTDSMGELTPLHYAVKSGDARIVRLFIEKGADINAPKTDGQTPLYIACECGHKDVVELLLAKGADLNVEDNKRQTALSLAKKQGHDEIVELLRRHGARE
jgi:cytohesin